MNLRILLPVVASLAALTAVPASAQSLAPRAAPYGYDAQGGGGAGPYDLRCQQFGNYNQRQACTQQVEEGYGTRDRHARVGYRDQGPPVVGLLAPRHVRSSEQGGGGAGPFDPRCRQFSNFNQREACTAEIEAGYQYRGGGDVGPLGFFGNLITGGDAEQTHTLGTHRG